MGSFEIIDDGRSILIDIKPEYKVFRVKLILTHIHGGAKFSNKTY
ncbi:hypothetical protein [Coxiella-like endosymbiont]|nr:hypothetical protein [Coxiella-like endosymbiont]PMB54938.1 hypothetical protein CLERM_598 [Coxiella-like endosymbiont]PMB54983.1 hypothetical protein CLERM_399 [Coxiella-like endosymbiont]